MLDDDSIKKHPIQVFVIIGVIIVLTAMILTYNPSNNSNGYSSEFVDAVTERAKVYSPHNHGFMTSGGEDAVNRSINTIENSNCDELVELWNNNPAWHATDLLADRILKLCL